MENICKQADFCFTKKIWLGGGPLYNKNVFLPHTDFFSFLSKVFTCQINFYIKDNLRKILKNSYEIMISFVGNSYANQ